MNQPKRTRTNRTYMSYALFALSALLFILAGYGYLSNDDDSSRTPPPPSNPGKNEAVNVFKALEDQGVEVEYGRNNGRSNEFSVTGQLFLVDGQQLYVFIYSQGVAQREAETDLVDPAAISILNTRGTPVAEGTPKVFIGSNVIAVLYGGDDELAGKVQRAIEGLP